MSDVQTTTATGSTEYLLLRSRPRHVCELAFEGDALGPPQKFVLRPSAADVGAYEAAVLAAIRTKGPITQVMIAASFTYLAVAEDGTRLEERLLKLPTDAQLAAADLLRRWYDQLRPAPTNGAVPGSDPTSAVSGSRGGSGGRSARSRRSPRRSSS